MVDTTVANLLKKLDFITTFTIMDNNFIKKTNKVEQKTLYSTNIDKSDLNISYTKLVVGTCIAAVLISIIALVIIIII